jgi:hypothetical protein
MIGTVTRDTSAMKLCSDCRWVKDPGEFAQCVKPRFLDPSTGEGRPNRHGIRYCFLLREDGWFISMMMGWCGRAGRFFEPREEDVTLDEATGEVQGKPDHYWAYGGTSPDTICIRCGLRRDEAPLAGGGQQRYAPCSGVYNTHLKGHGACS